MTLEATGATQAMNELNNTGADPSLSLEIHGATICLELRECPFAMR